MQHSTKILLILAILAISSQAAQAQDSPIVRANTTRLYAAINAGDTAVINSLRLPNFTHFNRDGRLLEGANSTRAVMSQGASGDRSQMNLSINDFNSQIYGSVVVTTFYLVGSYTIGEVTMHSTWRVSAVWVLEGRFWKEAHHHESPLMAKSHP